jgi:hypothetical protein
MVCDEELRTSAIKVFEPDTVQEMLPQTFQEELRRKHIVVIAHKLTGILCDRRGLTSLNSLKEIVDIEGSSLLVCMMGTIC